MNYHQYIFIDGVPDLLEKNGFRRLTQSTLQKICKPSVGQGPKPIGKWGKHNIYTPSDWLKWAEERIKPVTEPAAGQDNQSEGEAPTC